MDHAPNEEAVLRDQSFFVYMRQDPFKETIYTEEKSILLMLAQVVAAYLFLYFLGSLITVTAS